MKKLLLSFTVVFSIIALKAKLSTKSKENVISAGVIAAATLLNDGSAEDASVAIASEQIRRLIQNYELALKNKNNPEQLKELKDSAAAIQALLVTIQGTYQIPSDVIGVLDKIQKGTDKLTSAEVSTSLNKLLLVLSQSNLSGNLAEYRKEILEIEAENVKLGKGIIALIFDKLKKTSHHSLTDLSVVLPTTRDIPDINKVIANSNNIQNIYKTRDKKVKDSLGANKNSSENFSAKFNDATII